MEETFNYWEAVLWAAVALTLLIRSICSRGKARRLQAVLAFGFAVFSVSDVIEAHTGAWWEPLWLLAMKGACVLVFLFAFRAWYRLPASERAGNTPEKRSPGTQETQASSASAAEARPD